MHFLLRRKDEEVILVESTCHSERCCTSKSCNQGGQLKSSAVSLQTEKQPKPQPINFTFSGKHYYIQRPFTPAVLCKCPGYSKLVTLLHAFTRVY